MGMVLIAITLMSLRPALSSEHAANGVRRHQ
jgi:hypothetical protein